MTKNGFYEREADTGDYLYFVRQPGDNCHVHFHHSMELLLVAEGREKVGVNGRLETLTAGDISVANSYDPHYYVQDGPSTVYILLISGNYLKNFLRRTGGGRIENFLLDKAANAEAARLIPEWFGRYSVKDALRNQGYIDLLLASLAEGYPVRPAAAKPGNDTSMRMLRYLEEHFAENVSLDDLASYLGYSRTYCSRLFHAVSGTDLRTYLNGLRVEHAREILEGPKGRESTVLEVALSSGFESLNTFYRAYKREVGELPKQNKQCNI